MAEKVKMLNTKGIEYKSAKPIRDEDLDERLSRLEEAFKGLVQRLYRVGIIKEDNDRDNGVAK